MIGAIIIVVKIVLNIIIIKTVIVIAVLSVVVVGALRLFFQINSLPFWE